MPHGQKTSCFSIFGGSVSLPRRIRLPVSANGDDSERGGKLRFDSKKDSPNNAHSSSEQEDGAVGGPVFLHQFFFWLVEDSSRGSILAPQVVESIFAFQELGLI